MSDTTLDWYGCATFGLRTAGLHILLDAYIDRAGNAAGPQPRVTADDINDCDWIVIGHAHFDHLYGAERVMANTDARLIGSYESVRVMEQAGVPVERMIPVAGGETVALEGAAGPATVSVFPSQHSCVWSHGQMGQPDEVCLGDLGVTWQEQRRRFDELMRYLSTELDPAAIEHMIASLAGHSDRGDGGALVYRFDLPDGTLLFQDTSGHWSGVMEDLTADVAILAAAGRGNIDGEPIQGSLAHFVARQVAMISPKRVLLCHHDDWLPGFSVATDASSIATEIDAVSPDTELLEVDYLAGTRIFDFDD
ncbi:MAG: MBL fold metallo-hydrolase [Ilumatobacter sp.]|uniref:MBL fold metallo-hydrolase n=1 Tax=Ilumatobacter sp. TaxID=1967498 RepID=UPI00261F21FD|nr:MBL fold metallo-hydrolase [Ilumatobacter sp.]MDJ0770178.1 MBL fold metallo-hydrolase [Ilumatobacter sp.]